MSGTRQQALVDLGYNGASTDYSAFCRPFSSTFIDQNPCAGTKNIVVAYKCQVLRSYPTGGTFVIGQAYNNGTKDRSSVPTMFSLVETF